MAAETGFLIDGTVYEVPSLDSLTLDEEQVMYDACGVVQEDFERLDGESEEERDARTAALSRLPGLWSALMQIAYQRGNPTVKPGDVRLVVGKTRKAEAFSTLGELEEEPDEVPLALTSEPSESSGRSSLENDSSTRLSPVSSGTDATTASDVVDNGPANTGTGRSDTSSISAPTVSAA